MLIWGRAEGLACSDPGVRTPLGVGKIFKCISSECGCMRKYYPNLLVPYLNEPNKMCQTAQHAPVEKIIENLIDWLTHPPTVCKGILLKYLLTVQQVFVILNLLS